MQRIIKLTAGFVIGLSMAVAGEVGVVSHIKVLSDKVEDVSSLEAWKASFIKEGMTDEQKALAIWTSVCKFRHQDPPPLEYLTGDGGDVHDVIKTFNVYGYNMCCCESSNICQLARYAGMKARGWGINAHSVPEIEYSGAWHLLDASLVCYFKKPDNQIAGVEDIMGNVAEWYKTHPEYKGNGNLLTKYMAQGGWKKGPDILANTNAYDNNGWLPAATHGWYATMQEYDGRGGGKDNKAFLYEYGYSQGYEVNIQLRPGERITRNWGNKGLHLNMDLKQGAPGALTEKVGEGQLRYSAALGDLTNGRIGNGVHEYNVPIKESDFKDGVYIFDMPSSYVYLGGELNVKASLGDGGEVAFAISDNNGLDWKDVVTMTTPGEQKIDLKPWVYRRYDYRMRVSLKGKGTSVSALKVSHDIQHSQRSLPALGKGDNHISFSAGVNEGSVTAEGNNSLNSKKKQVVYTDLHPTVENMNESLVLKGATGSITFPISTPGNMTRLRFGSFYRARDAKDGFDYQVSFDNGKTFKTVDHAPGLTGNGQCKYVSFGDIPTDTKAALVRFSGTQRNTAMISNFRIDADYLQPNGGFRPVKITYNWEEDGKAKQDVHVAKSKDEKYTITCASKPVMKSIVLELAE